MRRVYLSKQQAVSLDETCLTKNPDSEIPGALVKVLRPAETRQIAGTVVVYAQNDHSAFDADIGFDFQVTQYCSKRMTLFDAVRL